MVTVISHNIVSPLGLTSAENYAAVSRGQSALRRYEGRWGLKEPFVASLFNEGEITPRANETRFERLVSESVSRALRQTDIDAGSSRVVFILSTTKGNVELLDNKSKTSLPEEREYPASAALHVAHELGFKTRPVVACNACISGLSALALGQRLIESGEYDYAVVCGADCQGKFIVSGFMSFKALSPEPCRPFDRERCGLNLGEAAATIILGRSDRHEGRWHIVSSAIRNDANHISGPSRTGEGSYRTLRQVMRDCTTDDLAFINVHGTATLYNDEMESIALERAGLTSTPVNALKGYYGHTMGAAGILESILSMSAVDDGNIIATRGFKEKGVSGNITINAENTPTTKQSFIKLLSGFGGCNAAMLFSKEGLPSGHNGTARTLTTTHSVSITPESAIIDGRRLETTARGKDLLTELYHKEVGDYPKFYKMDTLCRLGFIASELLLKAEGGERFREREDRAVILFNRSSSIVADKLHQAAISDDDNFFPSPKVFVYTLPNIVTGEIAIRNKYYGETSLYILNEHDEEMMDKIIRCSMIDDKTKSVITGWIECRGEGRFCSELRILGN